MLDLYLLHKAKKNYQYIIVGISIGLTLYTYALSYIIIPCFLTVWIIYMLYMKKIKIKQIILLGIPIFLLALPLIYMILLNNNVFNKTTFGIFTIPELPEYREGEIELSNIFKYGLYSLKTTFLTKDTLYYIQIPLFILGIVLSTVKTIKELKKREFSIDALLTLIFGIVLLSNLTVGIGTTNRINIIYIPILYFVTIGILFIVRKSWTINIIMLSIFIFLFINFEIYYYTDFSKKEHTDYEDNSLYYIAEMIENDSKTKALEKYIMPKNISEPYIYTLTQNKLSPYEFNNTKETVWLETKRKNFEFINKYKNYNFFINIKEINDLDYDNKKYIFIIYKEYENIIQFIESKNYYRTDYESYCIMQAEN